MRTLTLSFVLALCSLATVSAQVNGSQPKLDPFQPVSTLGSPEGACKFKPISKDKTTQPGYFVFKTFDVSTACIPPQFETTVPNRHKVALQFTPPTNGGQCTAAPSFKADPKADYASLFAAFIKSATPFLTFADTGAYFELPPASNGTLTIVITCTKVAQGVLPRTVIIHYKDAPLFSASAGSLVSLFPKRIYGGSTTQTGVNSSGVATTQNTVAITSASKVQFVPIAFLNMHLIGPNQLHLDLQAGAGINPNGSKTEVEYFFGPALSTHGVYISPGLHIARASYLVGGFSLGEVIPSGVTPPVAYRQTLRFAFAISYSPPVKSSN